MNNHYAQFENEGKKTVGVTDYTNQTPSKHFGNVLCSTGLYHGILGKGPLPKFGKKYWRNVNIRKNYRHKTELLNERPKKIHEMCMK